MKFRFLCIRVTLKSGNEIDGVISLDGITNIDKLIEDAVTSNENEAFKMLPDFQEEVLITGYIRKSEISAIEIIQWK